MELGLGINSFQINQRHVFPQNHFIETGDKVGIEESAVEDGQTETSPYKFEIAQMDGVTLWLILSWAHIETPP